MSVESPYILPEIFSYIASHSSQLHPVLLELHEKTQEFPKGFIQSSVLQATFLQILVKATAAKNILEIGTLAGFSALAMALAAPADAKIHTCDISDEYIEIGRPYWQKSGAANKIEVHLGDADETVDRFIADKLVFDFCYIDANKSRYPSYYEKCYQLLKTGGMMLMDNTLWGGKVVSDEGKEDNMLKGIKAANQAMVNDARIRGIILPIGDGMSIICKE